MRTGILPLIASLNTLISDRRFTCPIGGTKDEVYLLLADARTKLIRARAKMLEEDIRRKRA